VSDPITGAVVVYDAADNETRLQMLVNGTAVPDHSAITRAVLSFGTLDIDSDVAGALFDLAQTTYLGVQLGTSNLRKGLHSVRVKTYDAQHPNGVVWTDRLKLEVR